MIQKLFIVINIVIFAIQFERKHYISIPYITFVFQICLDEIQTSKIQI